MTEVINAIRNITELKVKVRPASSYFCDIEYKQIEVNPTIEVNLNKRDPGIDIIRQISIIAKSHGYDVDFFNGNPFIKTYRDLIKSEGITL
jgi:hypothetical protein